MATFNNLNVNEGANLHKLTIGKYDDNFTKKFLEVSDGKFTFYSDETDTSDELLTLQQSGSNKGSLASKAETVSFEAGTSVTLQGVNADNQLELTSDGSVLKGAGDNNKLSLTSTGGAVLTGDSTNKLELTSDGGAVLTGASDNNKLSLTSDGGAVLQGAGVDNQLSLTSGSAVLKSNDITFKFNDDNNFMKMTKVGNSKRNINVDADTTFNSNKETNISGDLNLGDTESGPCTVVLSGAGSSLTASDSAKINFSSAEFNLENGGTFTVSGENFLSKLSTQQDVDNAIAAETQPANYKNRLLRHRGVQLEQDADDTSKYNVVNESTAYFYTSSGADQDVNMSLAKVRKRVPDGDLHFKHAGRTYEQKDFPVDTNANAVLVKNDDIDQHVVDRLVETDTFNAVLQRTPKAVTIELLGETYTMKSIDRAQEGKNGNVMYAPTSELYLEDETKPLKTGWSIVLPPGPIKSDGTYAKKKLTSKRVYGGLDVWYENDTQTKFIVHNYNPDVRDGEIKNNVKEVDRHACGWYMLQLFGQEVQLTEQEKADPVSNLLRKDLDSRVLISKLTSTNPDEHGADENGADYTNDGIVHHTLVGDVLPSVGKHVMLNKNFNDTQIPCKINEVVKTTQKDGPENPEYWMRVRTKRNMIFNGTGKAKNVAELVITTDDTQNFVNWKINKNGTVSMLLFVYKVHENDTTHFDENRKTGWYRFEFGKKDMDEMIHPDTFVVDVGKKKLEDSISTLNAYATYNGKYEDGNKDEKDHDATTLFKEVMPAVGSNEKNSGVNVRLKDQVTGNLLNYISVLAEHPGPTFDTGVYFSNTSEYQWIAPDTSINASGKHPYISRQQSSCMLAPVVLEPMLRTALVTVPTYQFLGGQAHAAKIGVSATYAKSSVHDVSEGPLKIDEVNNLKIGGISVKAEHKSNASIRPLVLVNKTAGAFRVATIENADAFYDGDNGVKAKQKYYVSKNASGVEQAWIFPNYGPDGGWYSFSSSSASGEDYGTVTFWEKVQADTPSLSLVLTSDTALYPSPNYTMNTMNFSASTSGDGAGLLTMYEFEDPSVSSNQLFSTDNQTQNNTQNNTVPLSSGDDVVLQQVNPLDNGTWTLFKCYISGDDGNPIILSQDTAGKTVEFVTGTVYEVGQVTDVDGNPIDDKDINELNEGQTVTINNEVYYFWNRGGGAIDAQDMIVRNTLTVEGPSTLNHVSCETLAVRSEYVALGTKAEGTKVGISSKEFETGDATLYVKTKYWEENNEGNAAIKEATTFFTGGLELRPVGDTGYDNDNFTIKNDVSNRLQMNFNGKLNVNGPTHTNGSGSQPQTLTKIYEVDSKQGVSAEYKFGSLTSAVKLKTDGTVNVDKVTIGTTDKKGLEYNLADNTATSTGLTHKWDSFMTYTKDTSLAVGLPVDLPADGDLYTRPSLFVDGSGVKLGHHVSSCLTVPNYNADENENDNIAITRNTDVTDVTLKVQTRTNAEVQLSGSTNKFDKCKTTFGNDTNGKLEIINNNNSNDPSKPVNAVTSTLPLITENTVTMNTTASGDADTVTNVALTDSTLTLRNNTVTIEGASGDQNIVISKADPKTSFYQDLEVIHTTTDQNNEETYTKFFDVDVDAKEVNLTDAKLYMNANSTLESEGNVKLTGGSLTATLGAGNWLNLNTDSGNLQVGNLTVSGDTTSGNVEISGGIFKSSATKWNVISPENGGFLTIDTQGAGDFKAGKLVSKQTTNDKKVAIDGTAFVVPDGSGDITITRDVSMGNNKLTVKDFEVKGTMTTVNSQEVNIGDSNILLNAFNATGTPQGAGILVNCKATDGDDEAVATATWNGSNFTDLQYVAKPGGNNYLMGGFKEDAIIMVVAKDGTDIVESNMNGIWMAGDQVTDNKLTVKAGTNAQFVKNPNITPDLPAGAVYHITRVMVHHLKFDMSEGTMSHGGSVFYGHGSEDSHFGGDYGYRDIMMGDIHSSVIKNSEQDYPVSAAITKTSANVKLPTGVEGATYRVINTNTNATGKITVSTTETKTDNNNNIPLQTFTLNPEGHSRYTYIKDSTGTGGTWYEQF